MAVFGNAQLKEPVREAGVWQASLLRGGAHRPPPKPDGPCPAPPPLGSSRPCRAARPRARPPAEGSERDVGSKFFAPSARRRTSHASTSRRRCNFILGRPRPGGARGTLGCLDDAVRRRRTSGHGLRSSPPRTGRARTRGFGGRAWRPAARSSFVEGGRVSVVTDRPTTSPGGRGGRGAC